MKKMSPQEKTLAVDVPKPQRKGRLRAVVTVLFVVLLILAVSGIFVSRTVGFRKYIQERIRENTGAEFNVESCRISWPYDLVLDNVKLAPRDAGSRGGMSFREVRIGLRAGFEKRVVLTGCRLTLIRTPEGGWEPREMEGFGDLKGVEDLSTVMADLDEAVRMEIRNGRVEWLDAQGAPVSSIEGLEFRMTPVRVPGRRMYHFHLEAREVLRPGGGRIRDVEREWICAEGRPYLEIEYRANWGKAADADDLWSRSGVRKEQRRDHED